MKKQIRQISKFAAWFMAFALIEGIFCLPHAFAQTGTTATTSGPLPTAKAPTTKSIQLAFDNLNDFAVKGLPPSAAVPTGNFDQAAAVMAQQIARLDENSLPVLLAALQMAGFTIIDENGKALLKPADGKGQGLGFYDFEAVGSLTLAKSGIIVSLEKIAGTITKGTPEITASDFAESLLKDLRAQANNSDNPYLRFHSRLIIELGKASAKPIDLLTAPASSVILSPLQASLMIRRLQGDLYAFKSRIRSIGMNGPPFGLDSTFAPSFWEKDRKAAFRLASFSPAAVSRLPCNLSSDQSLILDATSVMTTTINGGVMKFLEKNIPGIGKISKGVDIANIVLAWGKLVAAVTMLKGEITVEKPLPLKRTVNSVPGEKKQMVARIWNEVGKKELVNCVRTSMNIFTGLDFNLPTDGPVGDTFIEWQFEGEATTNLDSKKFVFFDPPPGADRKPNKQLTDKDGISKMNLVGYPKKPPVVNLKKAIKVQRNANVLVRVTLKSAKDFVQNWIDIGGLAIGLAMGGPLALGGAAAEIGFRLPLEAARATIPVTDHEPCDQGDPLTEVYWYLDYTVTVKGKSSSVAEGGSPTSKWSIDRIYSSRVALNERHIDDSPELAAYREKFTAEMAQVYAPQGKAMDPGKLMAGAKTLAKLQEENDKAYRNVTFTTSKDVQLRVQIDDRLEQYSEEVCTDDSEETTTQITMWKADATYPGPGSDRLVTDNELLVYNVWIPAYTSDPKSKMSIFTQKKYGRTGGVVPSKQDTDGVEKKIDVLGLPDIEGLIKGVIEHMPVRPHPTDSREFEFDSGDLTPDRPLIAGEPDSQTDVKVRVVYRFTRGCK